MAATEDSHEEVEHLFLRRDSATSNARWCLLGGILALVFAGIGFAVAIFARVDQLSMHAITTLPTLLGIGALTAARTLASTPQQVAIGPQGLRIEGRRGSQSYPWDQIGWATMATGALNQRRQLVVYDTSGKSVATLSEAFGNFDAMAELVRERIADKPDDTSERIREGKSKRSALMTAAVSIALLTAAGAIGWMAHREQRASRLLEEVAVPGEAEIERRFLAPNGVTPRLEYRITTADGLSATRNAEVTRDYWDRLEEASSVPVVYVADEPAISRLTEGEAESKDFMDKPAAMYGLSIAGGLLSLVLLVAAALQWHGWDIDLDSKTGKVSIKRFGTGS